MSNLAPIVIGDTLIHHDGNGYFNLNDLHEASGGEKRHQPSNWLRLDTAQELIKELESEGLTPHIRGVKPESDEVLESYDAHIRASKTESVGILENYDPQIRGTKIKKAVKTIVGRGKAQGTYVVRELAYAYSMWVSAKFHVLVVRAFDAVINNPQKITSSEHAKISELETRIKFLEIQADAQKKANSDVARLAKAIEQSNAQKSARSTNTQKTTSSYIQKNTGQPSEDKVSLVSSHVKNRKYFSFTVLMGDLAQQSTISPKELSAILGSLGFKSLTRRRILGERHSIWIAEGAKLNPEWVKFQLEDDLSLII